MSSHGMPRGALLLLLLLALMVCLLTTTASGSWVSSTRTRLHNTMHTQGAAAPPPLCPGACTSVPNGGDEHIGNFSQHETLCPVFNATITVQGAGICIDGSLDAVNATLQSSGGIAIMVDIT